MTFVLEKEEIIVGRGENAGFQLFLHFSQCFFKSLLVQGC